MYCSIRTKDFGQQVRTCFAGRTLRTFSCFWTNIWIVLKNDTEMQCQYNHISVIRDNIKCCANFIVYEIMQTLAFLKST